MKKYYPLLAIGAVLCLSTGCQSVPGNSLFVSQATSDNAITASINNTFANNAQLAGIPVHVETNHGSVLLTGYVKTIRQSDVAGDLATKTPGVKAVENNLIVRK